MNALAKDVYARAALVTMACALAAAGETHREISIARVLVFQPILPPETSERHLTAVHL